jgi:hypothetical protein
VNKKQHFLLAIRQLEKDFGLYLESSEWMSCSEKAPDDRFDGVFQATDTPEETQELIQAQEVINKRT